MESNKTPRKSLFLVALTGGIASGKSTVGSILEEKGARVLDSDLIAREVVHKGTDAWREIVGHFGEEILQPSGEIDRKKLADIVFEDPEERALLNRITHPRVFLMMAERLKEIEAETGGRGVVVLDIPLLVESKAAGYFDFTLVVDTSPEIQVLRLERNRGSSDEEARARIRSQASRQKRLESADLVIPNDGSMDDLRREVDKAWETILQRSEEP